MTDKHKYGPVWRGTVVVALAATFLITTSAYAQVVSEQEATLKVFQWVNQQMIDSTEKATIRFKEKYPNVTIETQFIPLTEGGWGEYNNTLLNEVAAGKPPDIFAAAIEGFAEVASKDVLLDLEVVAGQDPDVETVLAGIDPNLLDGMRTRPSGVLNFFPTEWNNIVMYYNKDLFDAAGIDYPSPDWTWQEFVETAKALTISDDSGNITQFGYFVPGFNFGLQPWLFTNDAAVLDDEWRESTVTTPEFRETLQFLFDLIHVHMVAPAFEGGHGAVGDNKFVAGQVAMFSAGHWPLPEIIAGGLTNVGVQHMPKNTRTATVYGIGGLSITKFAEHPDIAWAFIKEMTGDQYQQELADSMRSIPTARRFATTDEWTAFPDNSHIFYETAATAIAVPSPPNFAQVENIFLRHLDAYLNDNQDLDTTISQMDRELSRAMSRAYN